MATPIYKKYVQLDDGSFAMGVVPEITGETMSNNKEDNIAYVVLANGLFAKAIVPLDEDGNVNIGTPEVDESETVGDKWAFVILDDGTWAEAVVCIDENGDVI